MTTVEERFDAVAQALYAAGGDISTKLRTLTRGVAANSMAIEEVEEATRSLTAETRQRIEALEAAVKALTAQPTPAEPSPPVKQYPLDVLRPDGYTIAPRPGTAKFSTLEIVNGQVVHRGGSAYVAPGSSVLADHDDDWYEHIRLDAIAATIVASSGTASSADLLRVEERARQWVRTDLRKTLDTGGSNGVAIYTHLAGLYFAAGKLGIDLAGDDLTRHTTELTTLLKASFRPNHNFRTGSLLLLASYLSASSATADKDWATWADLWEDHLQTILKTLGVNVVDVHSATHGSGRGMHYTVMSMSGYLTGEAIMRTLDLPRTLPDSLLARAVETPWYDILRWAKKDTWTSDVRFEWVAANGVRYNDNGAVNHDLVSFVSNQAAALGYNMLPSGSPKPTPYWSHTMPLTAAQ